MKHRTFTSFVAALVIGSVTLLATTDIAGSSAGKVAGCKDFEWRGTSTARGFNSGMYTEDGVVTKGLSNATYHVSVSVAFSGPFITTNGQVTVDAGNGDTLVMQNQGGQRNVSGPVPLGGVAFFDGGTGAYAGAAGNLTLSGTGDLDFSKTSTRTYVGELCLP